MKQTQDTSTEREQLASLSGAQRTHLRRYKCPDCGKNRNRPVCGDKKNPCSEVARLVDRSRILRLFRPRSGTPSHEIPTSETKKYNFDNSVYYINQYAGDYVWLMHYKSKQMKRVNKYYFAERATIWEKQQD